ncbi:hypothetical protein N7535_009432 [Penicillium sp. DV-2018c]|nr:hypothetical protein N7535_009432 [Penicillium sp. DV-2018c]
MPATKPENRKRHQFGSEDLVPFDHAAAGHDGVQCTLSGALIAKPCTRQEIEFYESSALHPAFQEFMPLYIGSLSASEQQQPPVIAAAQHAGAIFLPSSRDTTVDPTLTTESTSHPVAARENVKLGARLWADDAPLAKRTKLDAVSKETTSGSLGFRIAGMKVWTGHNGETDSGERTDPYDTKHEGAEGEKGEVIEKDGYRRYDKWYGRSFNEDNIKQAFETFLAGAKMGKVDRSKFIAQRLAEELKTLQQIIESEESRMYSASVLVIYEGDPEAMELAVEEEQKAPAPRSREEEEDEDEDDEEFEIPEGAMELVDVQLGAGMPQQAMNINIDPQTMPMPAGEDEEEEENTPKVHDLRLIDFAHAEWTPGQGPDENVLKGVRSLVKIMGELAD